ncbi:MAG: hypothetical protein U1C04_18680 [Hydrogenophaga sp.]|nr:hypothetical protein [Hydrogenophaga sp.]
MTIAFQPRMIRQKHAPAYMGVDRNKFNAEFRPHLTEVPLGPKSLAYDRHELDELLDAYIATHGRPGPQKRKDETCEPGQEESSWPMTAAGPSTRNTKVNASSSGSAKSARPTRKIASPVSGRPSTSSASTMLDAALNACGQMRRRST